MQCCSKRKTEKKPQNKIVCGTGLLRGTKKQTKRKNSESQRAKLKIYNTSAQRELTEETRGKRYKQPVTDDHEELI